MQLRCLVLCAVGVANDAHAMRLMIQRVASAHVVADGVETARIQRGLLVLLGVGPQDAQTDADWLAGKLARLRIFPDDAGKMNRSVVEVQGGLIIVSQFTLFAQTAKGNRPAFTGAAAPAQAIPLYEYFLAACASATGIAVGSGRFGANMQLHLVNDGPVTIWMDSQQRE